MNLLLNILLAVNVHGSVDMGLSTRLNEDNDEVDYTYIADAPLLGTSSGDRYTSVVDDKSRNLQATYGADLDIEMGEKHVLSLKFEGKHDYERAIGTRDERLTSMGGAPISRVFGTYDHGKELTHELEVAAGYAYHLRRPGEMIKLGYSYLWENENGGLEQEIEQADGWYKYTSNMLEQRITTHHHHASLDYVIPAAKGHIVDMGLAYDRRELSVLTEQEWNEHLHLESDYRHLTQYGGLYGRYRMKVGRVEAMARLEYRATRMQQRWLHDVLPTANIRYHIDSIHSLSAFYTIVLIRPKASHLDSTHIEDAFTTSYGSDAITGMHVHNVALAYHLTLSKVRASFEARYLTASDGFNAIWMERGGQRIYTWGNEGVRHAVGLTPTVDAVLSPSTKLHATATVMWDERIADVPGQFHLTNPNWGLRSKVNLSQQLYDSNPATVSLLLRGEYSCHNTLDVYSYEGHGGLVGIDAQICAVKKLHLSVGYSCIFKPNIHILQGAYVGKIAYRPGATHVFELKAKYEF